MPRPDCLRLNSRTSVVVAVGLLLAAIWLFVPSWSKRDDAPTVPGHGGRAEPLPHLSEWGANPPPADAVLSAAGMASAFDMARSSLASSLPIVGRLQVDAAVHLSRSADWWLLQLDHDERVVGEHVGTSMEGPSDATASIVQRIADRAREGGEVTWGLLISDDAPWSLAASVLTLALQHLLPRGSRVVMAVPADTGIAELHLRPTSDASHSRAWLSLVDRVDAEGGLRDTTRLRIVNRPVWTDGPIERTRIFLRDPEARESGPGGPSEPSVLFGDRARTEEQIADVEDLLLRRGATAGSDIEIIIGTGGSGSWKELRTALLAAARVSGVRSVTDRHIRSTRSSAKLVHPERTVR